MNTVTGHLSETSMDIDQLLTRAPREQCRALRASGLRDMPTVLALLRRIDAVRHDDPATAARLSHLVATVIAPRLEDETERARVFCRALSLNAASRRGEGDVAGAARALRCGLRVARRRGLADITAELLQRSGYVLADRERYAEALVLLREALDIHIECCHRGGAGKALVDQGTVLLLAGDDRGAVLAFERALRFLPTNDERYTRGRLAAYQNLALAFRRLGDLDASEACLDTAVRAFRGERGACWAKLVWQRGCLAHARGELAAAEQLFRQATEAINRANDPELPLLSLDLIKCLLDRGRLREAAQIAKGMAALLMTYRGNHIAEAAILAFARAALEGKLTQRLAIQVQAVLRGRSRAASSEELSTAA